MLGGVKDEKNHYVFDSRRRFTVGRYGFQGQDNKVGENGKGFGSETEAE